MTAAARLRVDPIACDGRGLCAEVLPELIILDDWGFPIVSDHDVPPGLRHEAAEAIRLCPKFALRLDHAAGTPAAPRPVTEAQLDGLPGAAQRHLRFMGAIGRPADPGRPMQPHGGR